MNARRLISAAAASLSLLAGCTLVAAPAALASGEEGCPNEAIRTSQDANALPECRAWELVTPAQKDNIEARVAVEGNYSDMQGLEGFVGSSTGDRMVWSAEESVPQAKEVTGAETVGVSYLAKRGEDGWSSEDVIPRQSPENGLLCASYISTGVAAYTADLSKWVLADGAGQNYKGVGGAAEEDCGHNEPALVPEEPAGFQDLFVRDGNLLSYQLVNVTPAGV